MRKRPLQIVVAALALIPVLTGAIAMSGIDDPLYASAGLPRSAVLDSNMRFFGGVWLALGLALYWLTPRIEKETSLFRAICGAIFVGGIGRLISLALLAAPPAPFIGFTILEIVGMPALIAWQSRVSRQA
jgi:Domain of unknown function (DUF4345)